MRTIICTTGTSIARGCRSLAAFQGASAGWDADAGALAREIEARLGALNLSSDTDRIAASAELNSLHRLGVTDDDTVVLLATDTADGRACAEATTKAVVKAFGLRPEHVVVRRVPGLQVRDGKALRETGIVNLLTLVMGTIGDPQQRYGREIILNPTGGFKGVVPFLAILGMLFRLRTVYIFEASDTLVTLPPLPVSFDLGLYDRARPGIQEIAKAGAVPEGRFFAKVRGFQPEERDLFMGLLEADGGLVTLSPLAAVFHQVDVEGAHQLRLSPSAAAALNAAHGQKRGALERLLSNLREPLWRATHVHSFTGTDLWVFKPGNTAERAACALDGKTVYVCCLYASHDDYDRDLPGRRRADFEPNFDQCVCWEPAPDLGEGAASDRQVIAENTRLRSQLDDCRRQLDALKAEVSRLRGPVSQGTANGSRSEEGQPAPSAGPQRVPPHDSRPPER